MCLAVTWSQFVRSEFIAILEYPAFPRIGAGIPQSALSCLRRQIKTVENARGTAHVVVDTYGLTGDLRGHYESPEAILIVNRCA